MQLRDYQQRAVDDLYKAMGVKSGHACLVLPTGAGKSHIVAYMCRDIIQNAPYAKVLMLTHQKELIEQNAQKMREYWPNAPLGIYSASVGRKEMGEPITFAGIQSIGKKSLQVGHVDAVIVDECHLINHKAEGTYRTFINALAEINPNIKIIGLTATPYRLGHGYITDGDALFDYMLEPVTVEELIYKGYLAKLKSKGTGVKLSVQGVGKRGGEFIESELQKAVDKEPQNVAIVDEVIARAEDRKSWLFFCTGIDHATHVKEALEKRGISAACITGKTPKREREALIAAFKSGKIKALTNANVLTTGFDYPGIDLIALMRPTMSPSLYMQMVGRGLRKKDHTDHCLVLDFAGNIETHGPITNVRPPAKKGDGTGDAPVKICDECDELVHPSVMVCPECGYEFPPPEPKKMSLRDDDIMGNEGRKMKVTGWQWVKHTGYNSGVDMLKVSYYGALSEKPVTEYLCVNHDGYAGQKAMQNLAVIARSSGATGLILNDLDGSCAKMNNATPPHEIEYFKEGKFHRVSKRNWL